MTRSEIALLLGACSARDQRTVGAADIEAWLEDLGDIEFADGRRAVSLHYRDSVEFIKPAHIRRQVKILRDKDRAGQVVAALPAAPSQPDPARDARIARNRAMIAEVLAEIAAKRSVPEGDQPELTESERIHQRALEVARQGRRPQRLQGV